MEVHYQQIPLGVIDLPKIAARKSKTIGFEVDALLPKKSDDKIELTLTFKRFSTDLNPV
jgi:hypothetical protein